MVEKVNKIEKTVVEEVVTWVALDGTEFKNENDCKEWEDSFKCAVTQTFNSMAKYETSSLTLGIPYSNDDHTTYVVMPKNQNDIVALNSIMKHNDGYGYSEFGFDDIGKKFIMVFGWYRNENMLFGGSDYVEVYDLDKHKNNMMELFDKIDNVFDNENAE